MGKEAAEESVNEVWRGKWMLIGLLAAGGPWSVYNREEENKLSTYSRTVEEFIIIHESMIKLFWCYNSSGKQNKLCDINN